MASPVWLAATSGQPGQAGQVNQFLTTHPSTFVYQGALRTSSSTAGTGSVNSNGLYVAQSFTTASTQTTTGYVVLIMAATGSPAPWQVTLQQGSAGVPSGTALAAAQLGPAGIAGPSSSVTILLPASGLAASTQYWIVTEAAGDSSDYFSWFKSSSTSGAATSADGVTWTAASYGLLYQVYDGSPVGSLVGIYEDGGARSTVLSYSSGLVAGIAEITAGQAGGYAASERTLSYSGGQLTGIA